MKQQLRKMSQGFTIIEVMIVLAIAGLILAIVFIAVPQLQRNTRDNARQDVANRVKAEIETYAGNNQGIYPFRTGAQFTMADFVARYITNPGVRVVNPSTGNNYTIQASGGAANNPTADQLFIYPGMTCAGENVTGTYVTPSGTTNTKQYALRVLLDRANTYYCIDNG